MNNHLAIMYLLLITTLSCFFELVVGIILKYILARIFCNTKFDQILRSELISIKEEMSRISMINEFPKYAKLQRKYNKLETELKESVNARMSSRRKVRSTIIYVLRIINTMLILVLLYNKSGEPVAVFPNGMLFPLENVFKWPGTQEGGISMAVWILMTRTVASLCNVIA